jgi:hypothetical protein
VLAPPAAYSALPCAAETGGALLAAYSGHGALSEFAWAMSPEEVRRAVDQMLRDIVEP